MFYCKFEEEADIKIAWKIACLREQATRTIRYMQESLELGRTIIVDNTATTRRLCAMVSKKNIVWLSRDGNTDEYAVPMPDTLAAKDIEVIPNNFYDSNFLRMKLDFLNSGHPTDFYSIEIRFHHVRYHWYLVVAPGEEEIIRDRMQEAASSNVDDILEKFIADLTIEDIGTGRINPVTTYPKRSGTTARFKTRLIDASNTKIYGNGYTDSQPFTLGGKTYLIAQSIGNGGPTAALFRPNPSGGLDLLCYHRAPPSRAVTVVDNFDKSNPKNCPANAKKIPTELDGPGTNHVAQIFASGWGGTRPVMAVTYVNLNKTPEATLSVGELNAQSVDQYKSAWNPVAADFAHQVVGLQVTEAGVYVYVWDNDDGGATYYKVEHGGLVPACVVKREIIPPVGYSKK